MVSGKLLFFFGKTLVEFSVLKLAILAGTFWDWLWNHASIASILHLASRAWSLTTSLVVCFGTWNFHHWGLLPLAALEKQKLQLSVVSRKAILLTFLLWSIDRSVIMQATGQISLCWGPALGGGGRKRREKGWAQGNGYFLESCDKHQQIISNIKNVR